LAAGSSAALDRPEAFNSLFQAAKRKARGYSRFQTMKAGKLDFTAINSHAA
jgi:hypothetical protein